MSLFQSLFPNVVKYWNMFLESLQATFQMFFIAGIWILVIGGALGILLVVTRSDGIRPNKGIHVILEIVTNIFRSIPFIILLIFLIPLTRFITGTSIGVTGAIVPLVFGAVPFFARQVESALSDVDLGKIEAARAMGSGTIGIIFRVYLHEALPDLFRAVTITSISLVGLTTSAGAVGAGGIGSFAINQGQNMYYQDVVNLCVLFLLVFVSLLQLVGNSLAHASVNKKLFK